MQSKPSRAHNGRARRPKPKLRAVVGGLDLDAFEEGRAAAALAHVDGVQVALDALHPDDVLAIHWYRARLDNCRTIAGLPPLTGGPLWALEDDDERTEGIGPLGVPDRRSMG
jgi:hypothetical protein